MADKEQTTPPEETTKKTPAKKTPAKKTPAKLLEEYRSTGRLPKGHVLRVERGRIVIEKA